MRVINVWGAMMPLLRERAVRRCEIEQRHFARAQRQRRHRGQRRADAEAPRVRLRRRDADQLHDPAAARLLDTVSAWRSV